MSHRPPSPARVALFCATLLALAALAISLAGCKHAYGSDGLPLDASGGAGRLLAPAGSGIPDGFGSRRGLFYPLAVGNFWSYSVHTRTTITTAEGPQPPVDSDRPWMAFITGTEQLGGRQYFLQSEFDPRAGAIPPPGFPMREDASGLFELDLVFPSPAAAAGGVAPSEPLAAELAATVDHAFADPRRRETFRRAVAQVSEKLTAIRLTAVPGRGGPAPDEITLLRYPLFVGARWVVRDLPLFTRAVVARERVRVPAGVFAAWRLRGGSERFGPEDRVDLWYASAGLVRIQIHVVGVAVDDRGNLTGRVVTESDQVLTSFDLAGGGSHPSVSS